MTSQPAALASRTNPSSHAFGRYVLRRLLGKGVRTMSWLAFDPSIDGEVMLTMPRVTPSGAAARTKWLEAVRRASRLDHPHIAPAIEVSLHEHWPYIAVDRRLGITLDEWLATNTAPAVETAAAWLCDVLRALAFAHEAGAAHGDLQLHNLLIDERGRVLLMGLDVDVDVAHITAQTAPAAPRASSAMALETQQLRTQRAAAQRDVLACGVLLHRLLSGVPPLDDPDVARVIDRLVPIGREFINLPWATPQPVPEAMRAIVRRSTSSQPRIRYRAARTFLGALQGWREAFSDDDIGPIALLLERVRTVGHLPALPGISQRLHHVLSGTGQRTSDIANVLLPDLALSFELLRTLHSSQVQGTQVPGNGPTLTLRRVVALIGVDGVRLAANSLRPWPGPLDETGAAALKSLLDRVRLAGHTAQALRPAGYDAEVVYLITVLQNLGRMMARYHFVDESMQIDELVTSAQDGESPIATETAGLTENAAAFAVMGVDIDSLGSAVARQWGLDPAVQHMIRRLPLDAAVRKPDEDADVLRILGSAANEAVDAVSTLPWNKLGQAIAHIAQRYAAVLKLDVKAIQDALNDARSVVRDNAPSEPRSGRSHTAVEAGIHAAEGNAVPELMSRQPAV